MSEIFRGLINGGPLDAASAVVLAIWIALATIVISAGGLYATYFLVTLPLRRNERARLFLDLLELGLKEGRKPEDAIVDAAASGDATLGLRFHLLASAIQRGLRLGEALRQAPRLLPPQVPAVLRAGERIGDVGKVLPACRLLVKDGVSQVRGALNYLLLLGIVVTPLSIAMPLVIRVKVLPSFKAVFEGMGTDMPLPAFTQFVFGANPYFSALQVAFFVSIWVLTLAYLGGPRLRALANTLMPGLWDRVFWCLPWRRKRLQRDFTGMLAVLLDSGVPEAEAVQLAGETTVNSVMAGKAGVVAEQLRKGARLSEAIQLMDQSRELRWRLANGFRRVGGFVSALAGWQEALDAKAFQLEQTAAQVSTMALVLANGLIVGSIVIGIFMVLVNLINTAVLW